MNLTDTEKMMLDGREGLAVQKAMELLVRYGDALGAECLVDTNNVCGAVTAPTPEKLEMVKIQGLDHALHAGFSEMNLDSNEVIEVPRVKVYTCQLIQRFGPDTAGLHEGSRELLDLQKQSDEFFGARGVHIMATCTPYQVGNVPVKGEHCAWMESSAVVYCNSVLGALTNTEGRESTGAASLTGKIPYWGYHLPENRFGTHLVEVEIPTESIMDWGLLGYHVGEIIQDEIPVLRGKMSHPDLVRLKHFGAAAASSGGIEMYHIPGVTPEAPSLESAFGHLEPVQTLRYGRQERRIAYENLNSTAKDRNIDFVMLGCPHDSIEQVWQTARLLEGKRLHSGTELWIHTPRALRELADRSGYTKIVEDAGGHILSDSCPAISRLMPGGTKVVATDSAKQAHYLPAITGVQTWFGSLEDCVEAAVTGKWLGGLD
jgi:predicted aconitase